MDQQTTTHPAAQRNTTVHRIVKGVAIAVATVAAMTFLAFLAIAAMFSFGGFQIG